jgi:hypothetical protein
LQHYHPGDLRQWQAFEKYHQGSEEDRDQLIQAIRGYGQPAAPEPPPPSPNAWSLAWQLEKMQADQDAQLLLVDKGQDWLHDILTPEPWENESSSGPVDGVEEMVDPELAQLRYRLWRRVMAADLKDQVVPLLLGRTSRALFLTLKGWPDWTALKTLRLALPGCRSETEWLQVVGDAGRPAWQPKFVELLAALLTAVAAPQEPHDALRELRQFVEDDVAASWPSPAVWHWDLEIWLPDASPGTNGPVLCWGGAGGGILPG